MKITSEQYAQALLDAISETAPKDHDKVLDNFVQILKQNGDLEKFTEIEKSYKGLQLRQQGIKSAEVTMARDLEVNSALLKELNAIAGSKVEIRKKVDENIVGGVIIKVDDTLIDASVKRQLNNLNQSLKS